MMKNFDPKSKFLLTFGYIFHVLVSENFCCRIILQNSFLQFFPQMTPRNPIELVFLDQFQECFIGCRGSLGLKIKVTFML